METVTVLIKGFDQYKGRADVKHNSWFRCSNRLLEDHEFFNFSHTEIIVWIYLLSVASQKNTGKITVAYSHAETIAKLDRPSVDSAIKKLKKIGAIEVSNSRTLRGRYADVTDTCATRQTEQTEHNKHNITDTPEAQPRSGPHDLLEPFKLEMFKKHLSLVPVDVQESWLQTYEKDWIVLQLKEAVTWIYGNKAKAPKSNFATFFSKWLSRSWEWKRKGIASNKNGISQDFQKSLIERIQKAEAV